ncbi:hypothetical protein OSB04_008615 [Centaurea solstitialis]|uniref:Uncharacterized protein n=1 Tax=Centaurea solstitialis TaxID=347529 RepID=A0AA38TYX0_9ASTR|nr:hypothetical protein OSB04_008615 [Centaurea solstitialis]
MDQTMIGESDGDEYYSSKSQQISPHRVVKDEKREDNDQSLAIDRTKEAAKETQSRGSSSQKSNEANENNSSGNQSLTIDRTKETSKETESEIEKSKSRSSRSNGKSRVDKKRAVVNLPALVADLVHLQPAKERQSETDIGRGSHSRNSLEKSSRSRSSNDKSHVDKKKVVVIQPAAVADLVQPAKVTEGEIAINRGSHLHKSLEKSSTSRNSSSNDKSRVDRKKVMVVERATFADLVQRRASLPENGTCILGDLDVTDSSIVDTDKPVCSLVELASQVFDDTQLQGTNVLVMAETSLEQKNCLTSSSEAVGSVPKKHEVEKLVSLDGKSKDGVPVSMNDACHFCGRNTTDRGNEPETPECSEKQPLIQSAPEPAERTSWKSCCGIFELCSGSSR